ncbi:NEDD8 ultimate buster 1 isoform X2 [Phoenix dactylifera]|uniref:NEDD8 ultimate buster 1 isoform X2 n=1 Tax=Phoenix dactylifera TaxID=42345 RepID=A0A8B9ATR7_PHODC|nr:NEDD8 ultimate buster 1 isoform X2 [Phoenix dactylifera]
MDAKKSPGSPSAAVARLRIAGAWSGVLEVELEAWTLPMLRAEVARRSGGSPDCINLICGGKVLKDGEEVRPLSQLGLKNNSKVLASVVSRDRGKALNEEAAAEAERSKKLARIRDAAKALAERHADGSLPVEDYNIELEDQNGQKVVFNSESDRRAIMMGLMLHANAKSLIKKQIFKDALDVLYIAEEAFSLCDPKFVEMIDNVPILQLDIVWCYFMLQDISCLSMAGIRLEKARKGFEHSHGKDSTRFRLLQAGRYAELAIYVRLELLEGVVAYHSGHFEKARKALSSAQAKYVQLQVSDEALSLLMGMGYKEREAKRALRMTGQDIQAAVDFLVEERARVARRREDDIQRQQQIMEQKRYGRTPQNKAVNLNKLNELVSIGFERYLSAEALRLNENNMEKALDLLTDPERNCVLQSQLESRKKSKVSRPTAANMLLRSRQSAGNNQQVDSNPPTHDQVGPSGAAADNHMDERDEVGQLDAGEEEKYEIERDEAMEGEIAKELTGDPLADYDIEVAKEGEALEEYFALLDSNANASSAPIDH